MNNQDPSDGMRTDRRSPEQDACLKLTLLPGIGPRLYRNLIDRFGTALKVLSASASELQAVKGITANLAASIRSDSQTVDVQAEYDRCQQLGVRLVFDGDPEYPRALQEIHDPPPVLFYRGQFQECDALAVAIVGTRHASLYGKRQTERLAGTLARCGFTIVSGLARGIDAIAHRAALTAGGRTIAVLAGGLHDVYPPEHKELACDIELTGAVVSEFHSGNHIHPGIFPRRNRVISGLSLGVIVVEAGLKSGALSTARHAMEQNRDVFAVPGPIDSRVSRGCHELIRHGATLIESADDVVQALGPLVESVATDVETTIRHPGELQLNTRETQILQSIGTEPTTLDKVIERTGLPAARVLSTISVLEMRRLIRRLSGQLVCRI